MPAASGPKLRAATTLLLAAMAACGEGSPSDAPAPPSVEPSNEEVLLQNDRQRVAACLRAGGQATVDAFRRALERPDEFDPDLSGRFGEATAVRTVDRIERDETLPSETLFRFDGGRRLMALVPGAGVWVNAGDLSQCRSGLRDILAIAAELPPQPPEPPEDEAGGPAPSETEGNEAEGNDDDTEEPEQSEEPAEGPEQVEIGHAFQVMTAPGGACAEEAEDLTEEGRVTPPDFDPEGPYGSVVTCPAETTEDPEADGPAAAE